MTDPDDLPRIYELMGKVIADVKPVSKDQRNEQQRFLYRGIDGVLNAVGPALRAHGVFITAELGKLEVGTVEVGKDRKPMAYVMLHCRYHFNGPRGDAVITEVAAEAMDSGDKAVSKAWSVALRTALLQVFAIPTDEPDPDASSYERSAPSADRDRTPEAQAVADAALAADALIVVQNLWREASEHDLLDVAVIDPPGDTSPLRVVLKACGDRLTEQQGAAPDAPTYPTPAATDDKATATDPDASSYAAAAQIAEDVILNADTLDKISASWRQASQAGLLDAYVIGPNGQIKLRDLLTELSDDISRTEQAEGKHTEEDPAQ